MHRYQMKSVSAFLPVLSFVCFTGCGSERPDQEGPTYAEVTEMVRTAQREYNQSVAWRDEVQNEIDTWYEDRSLSQEQIRNFEAAAKRKASAISDPDRRQQQLDESAATVVQMKQFDKERFSEKILVQREQRLAELERKVSEARNRLREARKLLRSTSRELID